MRTTTEIAFGGEIQPATCECHKGQFVVYALQFHPKLGTRVIGIEMFLTEQEANDYMEKVVMKFATKILDAAGLKVDEATAVRVSHGDDAEKDIQRVFMQNGDPNPTLH